MAARAINRLKEPFLYESMLTMLPKLRKRPRHASIHDLIFSFSSSTSRFRRSSVRLVYLAQIPYPAVVCRIEPWEAQRFASTHL